MKEKENEFNPDVSLEEELTNDTEQESLLISLWRKFKKNKTKSGEEPVAQDGAAQEEAAQEKQDERFPDQESLTPEKVPFEKMSPPENFMQLYGKWNRSNTGSEHKRVRVEDFCRGPFPQTSVLEEIFTQIDAQAESYLNQYNKLTEENKSFLDNYLNTLTQVKGQQESGKKPQEEPQEESTEESPSAAGVDLSSLDIAPPMDAQLLVYSAPDWSMAWCMVFPPFGSGSSITKQSILASINSRGIVYGLLEENIDALVSEKNSFTLIPVAQGLMPVPGVDGKIIEHYPHDVGTPHLLENERGIVDFDNLNYLTHIDKDTVICDIIAPVPGTPGIDVRNKEIKAYNGKKPSLPMGQNVILNEDGTALIAKIDGQISFREHSFHVSNCIQIPGDVDLSTGSLDVRGDLIIAGNVLSGFTVRATGDITIGGIVEGSQITAGGTIIVNRGMNGNMIGTLTAGQNIYCKYMENSTVQADGDIYMDSCVNCEVSSNGRVTVTSGRGIIIGGNIVSMQRIESKIIGNKAGRVTTLSIAPTSHFSRTKTNLENELDDVNHQLSHMEETVDASLSLSLKILQMKQRKLKGQLEEMWEKLEEIKRGQIVTQTLYPLTNVYIGGVCTTIAESWSPCRIYLDGKEHQVRISW